MLNQQINQNILTSQHESKNCKLCPNSRQLLERDEHCRSWSPPSGSHKREGLARLRLLVPPAPAMWHSCWVAFQWNTVGSCTFVFSYKGYWLMNLHPQQLGGSIEFLSSLNSYVRGWLCKNGLCIGYKLVFVSFSFSCGGFCTHSWLLLIHWFIVKLISYVHVISI